MKRQLLGVALAVFGSVFAGESAIAAPAMQQLIPSEARNTATKLEVGPGRAALIDFPQNESIVYTVIGDRSRFVYSLDGELGKAKGVIVRKIKKLDFPGATETYVTNLLVTTTDEKGQVHRYFFDLVPVANTPAVSGIQIAPSPIERDALSRSVSDLREQLVSSPARQGWQTSQGLATPNDVRRGLQIAIERGYTPADDPIVMKVKNWIALVENGMEGLEALQEEAFSAGVLTRLGELGLSAVRPSLSEPKTQFLESMDLLPSSSFVDFSDLKDEVFRNSDAINDN